MTHSYYYYVYRIIHGSIRFSQFSITLETTTIMMNKQHTNQVHRQSKYEKCMIYKEKKKRTKLDSSNRLSNDWWCSSVQCSPGPAWPAERWCCASHMPATGLACRVEWDHLAVDQSSPAALELPLERPIVRKSLSVAWIDMERKNIFISYISLVWCM